MRLALDARVRPRSSFARVLELLARGAEAAGIEAARWTGGPCEAEVLWSVKQAELALPPGGEPRQVATVYDVNPLIPDGRPAWQRWRRARRFRRRAAAAVDGAWKLATVSEDAAARLAAEFPPAARRTSVVPLFPEPHFQPGGGPSALAEPGYVLFLGALRRHKNPAGLLHAYARLPLSLRERHPLLLAGRAHREGPALLRLAARLGVDAQLRLLDEVPEEELPGLYRGASVFAFPSLAEGFGLPPLEAMACGTPVVASDRTSLPEVLGEAALLVDPADPAALGSALERVLTQPCHAAALRAEGLVRAAAYGPERTGRAMRALLEA